MKTIGAISREEALKEGLLVDVSVTAREAGYKYGVSVAVTEALWKGFITPPKGVQLQDKEGRLWDVLSAAIMYGKRCQGDMMLFVVLFKMNNNAEAERITLKSTIGVGDYGESVVTIGLQEESW